MHWIVTIKPAPQLGGDPTKVHGRLLAWTEIDQPPALFFSISAALALNLVQVDMAGGMAQTVDLAQPDNEAMAKASTPPHWSLKGLKFWALS